jgi:hypothetical protein
MVRYKPSQFTKKELEIMVGALALDSGLDFLSGGKLNKYKRKVAVTLYRQLLKPGAIAALRLGGTAGLSVAGSAARAAVPLVTNPYLAGTALGLGALQTQPGQELLDAAAQSGRDTRRSLDMALFNIQALGEEKVKRTKSKFNVMVSKGMKSIKASTKYGKKGVINAPKKAFKAVVAAASAVTKKQKVPKSGLKRTLMLLMRR